MLEHFFSLNKPHSHLQEEPKFKELLNRESTIKDVLYGPSELTEYSIKNVTFQNVSFSKTTLKRLTFRHCRFVDCLFIGTRIEECEFHDCQFTSCNTFKIVIDNTYIDPIVFSETLDPKAYANIGVHLFQQLMKNSAATHQPEFRNTAEYLFRDWRCHQWTYEHSIGKLPRYDFYKLWLPQFIYRWLCDYGLRTRMFTVWTVALFSLTVIFNHNLWASFSIASSGQPVPKTTLTQSIYFTVVTLTTLGYGDFVPTSEFGMFCVTAECLLGIIWVSTLASIIIRRVVR